MNETQRLLTEYIGASLRGESPALPSDADRNALLFHAASTGTLLFMPDILKEKNQFGKHAIQLIAGNLRQEHEWQRLAYAFENAKADVMILKGMWIRKFYPQQAWRTMNDIDVLYKPEQKDAADSVMKKLGYELYAQGERHTCWVNYDVKLEVEMHHTLAETACADSEYFDKIWEQAVLSDGHEHVYEMTPIGSYAYFMRHLKTHIMMGDTSLRRLPDIYVLMLQGASAEICREDLKSVDSLEFAEKTETLVKQLFEGVNSGDPAVDEYAEMMLGNRSYGSLLESNKLRDSEESAIRYALREAFPKADKIYVSYPWAKKHKVLLPAGYLCRLTSALGSRSANTKEKVRQLKKQKLSSEEKAQLEAAKKLLKEIGC